MRNMISAALRAASVVTTLAVLLAVSAPAGITPAKADAAFAARDQLISDFCKEYPGASSCADWQSNRGAWSNDRYQSFYHDHRYEMGLDTAAAAAAFGPTTGGTAPGQDVGGQTLETAAPKVEVIGDSDNHVDDCHAAFRSYDSHTDTYLGFDGARHKCKL